MSAYVSNVTITVSTEEYERTFIYDFNRGEFVVAPTRFNPSDYEEAISIVRKIVELKGTTS